MSLPDVLGWIEDHTAISLGAVVVVAAAVGVWLVMHFGGALFPATGSCQYYHWYDHYTASISNGTTTTTFHHDYVCDKYYPLPTDDHGDLP